MRFQVIDSFKKQLSENNFIFEEITDEILWVKNFLTKDDLDFVLKIIEESKQEDWEVEYLSNLKNFCLQKFGRDDVENLVAEGKFEITQNWSDKNLNIKHHEEQNIFYERLQTMVNNSDPSLILSGLATIQ